MATITPRLPLLATITVQLEPVASRRLVVKDSPIPGTPMPPTVARRRWAWAWAWVPCPSIQTYPAWQPEAI